MFSSKNRKLKKTYIKTRETEGFDMKDAKKKRLVLIGIRRKGDHSFQIKVDDTQKAKIKDLMPVNQSLSTPLAG